MYQSYSTYNDTVTPARHIMGRLWSGLRDGADGGTFAIDGGPAPVSGYMVGGVATELVIEPEDDNAERYAKLSHWVGNVTRKHPDHYVGFWRDSATGKVHVDVSERVTLRSYALELAESRNEIAVWDLDNSEEIRVR